MPEEALNPLPSDWEKRTSIKHYDKLKVIVPQMDDLLIPKLSRGEPRDIEQAQWAVDTGPCHDSAKIRSIIEHKPENFQDRVRRIAAGVRSQPIEATSPHHDPVEHPGTR